MVFLRVIFEKTVLIRKGTPQIPPYWIVIPSTERPDPRNLDPGLGYLLRAIILETAFLLY